METVYLSKHLGHLGLVAGMIDELDIVSQIDRQFDLAGIKREVSIGTICKALVLNGLGFSQRTLYMVPTFFDDKPIELLLGSGIESSQLNDTVLGRALDAIHAYGCTELYAHLAPVICEKLGINGTVGHMDSTDFHLEGVYNDHAIEVDASLLHLTKGYSRDHRPDLPQVVLNLIVEHQAGIALHMQALNGNTSDKTAFQQTIKEYIAQLQNTHKLEYIIMDSAGYTAESLQASGKNKTLKWISRVPETLTESKTAIAKSYDTWTDLAEGYQCVPLQSTYAGVAQRWLLVFSKEAYAREMITLRKQHQAKSTKEYKDFIRLTKTKFGCKQDAQKAYDKFVSKCKLLTFNELDIKAVGYFKKKGRPKEDAVPDGYHYFIHASACCSLEIFAKMAHTKGTFILATNELDTTQLSDKALFENYKGQSKVERGFRFLKDPQFMAATFFVKKPERVAALLFIMTLCLSIYAAIEYRIRQALLLHELTLPNQLGKEVKNPTARWIFACFIPVNVLYIDNIPKILNLNDFHKKVIGLLGGQYNKYYLLI